MYAAEIGGAAVGSVEGLPRAMDGQRRHQEGVAFGHLGADPGIEHVAMLDGVDAATDPGSGARERARVGGHGGSAAMGGVHDPSDLRGRPR